MATIYLERHEPDYNQLRFYIITVEQTPILKNCSQLGKLIELLREVSSQAGINPLPLNEPGAFQLQDPVLTLALNQLG